MKISGLILFILFFIACKEKEVNAYSGYHLPRKKMVNILTDIVLAEGNEKVINKYGFNTKILIDSSYQFIYKSQNIEKWQMDSSFKYYCENPDEFTVMLEDVIENLNRLEN
jgi:hypothetical protein